MAKSPKTPEERAEAVEKVQKRARKGYKTNLKTKRSVTPEELIVIKDVLISLKLVGYSNSQCATIVGLSKGQVREIVSDSNFQKRLASLTSKLPEAAINLGKAYLVEAVQAVIHVLRTETDNALVLKAAAEIFDRFGIGKVSRTEAKVEIPSTGQSTEIPDDVMSKLRTAPPEVQAQVADLQDSFLEGVTHILQGGKEPDADSD